MSSARVQKPEGTAQQLPKFKSCKMLEPLVTIAAQCNLSSFCEICFCTPENILFGLLNSVLFTFLNTTLMQISGGLAVLLEGALRNK